MIEITKCQKRPPTPYKPHPKFGTVFAPHMLRAQLTNENANSFKAEITPYEGETFVPSTIVLHYGQSIFEGLKAFRQKDGSVAAFRADLHAKRFMLSAKKLAMPVINDDIFMECLLAYLEFEQDSVPSEPDHALYLRPLLIGRDEIVKVGRSKTYTLYFISCIVGGYFHGGSAKPAKVLVNREFVRAFPGGLGEAKTAANYAASLAPQAYAETLGCDQVLYLEAASHDFIDELGGMNFFIVKNGELLTPPLTGTILNGVTRRSIIELAPSMGLRAREEPLSFSELIKDVESGRVTESFACGTAAVVHPIGEMLYQNNSQSQTKSLKFPSQTPIATRVHDTLKQVQRGIIRAPGDWLQSV